MADAAHTIVIDTSSHDSRSDRAHLAVFFRSLVAFLLATGPDRVTMGYSMRPHGRVQCLVVRLCGLVLLKPRH